MRNAMLVLAFGLWLGAPPAAAEEKKKALDCEMTYSLKGWSALYKTYKGEGVIRCDNGQSAHVKLKVTGGGLTAGKTTIEDGKAQFSGVDDISELFGGYAQAGAHAGAVKASEATVLTKGEVSMALAGIGKGWSLGVDFGKFTIRAQ